MGISSKPTNITTCIRLLNINRKIQQAMKILSKYLSILFLSLPCTLPAISQVTISGPTCVVAGTVYQYTFSGSWDTTSTMQVCLTSGKIADSSASNSCTITGAPLATVLVVWNDSASGTGTVSLTSSIGNTTMTVNLTKPLVPG